jgi:hypothetical protein
MTVNLSKIIISELVGYSEEVNKALEEEKEAIAEEAVTDLLKLSPWRTGKYARSWRKKKQGTAWIVHNKEYRLVHLLEKGHAKRNGGRVKAQPHVAIVDEKVIQAFLDRVEKRI